MNALKITDKQNERYILFSTLQVYEVPWIGDQPQDTYGPPLDSYDPPQDTYGPPQQPEATTTEVPSLTTTLLPDTLNITTTQNNTTTNSTSQSERLQNIQGYYYIYHPTGLLQKVTYLTQNDDKDMTFSAQLKYKDVEPVKGPIYTYDPQTYVFSRLQR